VCWCEPQNLQGIQEKEKQLILSTKREYRLSGKKKLFRDGISMPFLMTGILGEVCGQLRGCMTVFAKLEVTFCDLQFGGAFYY